MSRLQSVLAENETTSRAAASSVRWLESKEEDTWDRFVGQHPLGLVYHGSAWKRTLEQAFAHIRGRILVLADPVSGAITAGVPVYTVRSRLLGTRIVSIPFASFCDPLISTKEEFAQLLPTLLDMRHEAGARRLEIRARRTVQQVENHHLHRAALHKHHILDLSGPPERLFAMFKKSSVRQMVVKAQKAGVVIVEGERSDDLDVCYGILEQTRRRLALPPIPFAFFDAMRSHLWPDQLRMFLALQDGRPAACILILASANLWICEHSGHTDIAIPGVNQALYWEAIRRAQSAGATAFSFGRTSTSNHGLLMYKRRWATAEEDIVSFESPVRAGNWLEDAASQISRVPAMRSMARRVPVGLWQMAGRFCYRHLG